MKSLGTTSGTTDHRCILFIELQEIVYRNRGQNCLNNLWFSTQCYNMYNTYDILCIYTCIIIGFV